MKNSEKYTTPKERAKAFEKFCYKNSGITDCHKCPLESLTPDCGDSRAQFAWLDLEAEEEKPLPCPFCGGECNTAFHHGHVWQVVCNQSVSCRYASSIFQTKNEAIVAHNQVAKAVMDMKESDAKHD